ncbi:MAG: class I SAM-dependent RNA methyltransferase [Clostridia bacterium]|nr:class I SAM-dependent RNA methyltransferase [Clostridia bacterium]
MEKFNLQIPASSGVEASVKRELEKLGFGKTSAVNGRILLQGDVNDVAKLNVNLRCGERVLWVLDTFSATDFDQLYDNIYRFNWQDYLPKDAKILLYAKSVKSKLGAIKPICAVSKKAIVDKLKGHYKCDLFEEGARFMIEVDIFEDVATVTLDTSGDGLHKRGYRSLAYTAPLKETLAASLIDMSYFHPEKPFADLFCGSGTLPIEAAMIALNIAPGLTRTFDCTKWGESFSKAVDLAKEEAKASERLDRVINVKGFDVNERAISIARYHARRAGVEDKIHLQTADMRTFSTKTRFGVLISNLPYGIRIGKEQDLNLLYKDFGNVVKNLPDWNCYVLTPDKNFERYFGQRASKHRKLYNANIECCYYSFPSKTKPTK